MQKNPEKKKGNNLISTDEITQIKTNSPHKPVCGLYLVATPIGNLEDITLRALRILKTVDLIACEDTRVSGKLLHHYGIKTPMRPYHDHNSAMMRPQILKLLSEGKSVALISDAGMPVISDPGFKLINQVIDGGYGVTSVPGASSVLTAMQLSGLPSDRFLFAGFSASKQAARQRQLEELKEAPASLIFFESAKRILSFLEDALFVLGDRPAAIARELTKKFEEVKRQQLSKLISEISTDPDRLKGEIVVIIGPPQPKTYSESETDALLLSALSRMSVKDASNHVSALTGIGKKILYNRALQLKDDLND